MTYAIVSGVAKKSLSKPLSLLSLNNKNSSRSIIKRASKRLTTTTFAKNDGFFLRPISYYSNNQSSSPYSFPFPLFAGAMMMTAASTIWLDDRTKCSADGLHPSPTPASVNSGENFDQESKSTDDLDLPVITSEQVAENNGQDGKPIWMSYGGVVYDVTNFIHNHPGGSERILLAAGSAIEPFWHLYRQHFATDLPMKLMESMIVGSLDEKDQEIIDEQMEKMIDETEDPYAHEPGRSKKLIVHGDQPMNAEVPANLITESYITPAELFYIRHHHPVPLLLESDLKEYEIEMGVSSSVAKYIQKETRESQILKNVTLDEIKKLPKVEVVTTLQCSGNRRGDMNSVKRTSGTPWKQGAISTAKWGGARLVDVLKLAGVEDPCDLNEKGGTQKHVLFEALDGMKASIHMEKATNPYGDVIIAYEMNDEVLPREHGFPLRVIVPGYSAVRNVKWVKKIEIATEEAEGAWQRGLNYKTLPPNVTDAKLVDLSKMPSMTEVSLFSGITKMEAIKDKNGENGTVMVKAKGWAWAGGGRNVVRVDITGDDGKSWTSADIVQGGDQRFGRAWAWVFWECEVPAKIRKDGTVSLASKAVDMTFNSQPEKVDHSWNVRGLGNNSWYRAVLKV